MSNTVNSIFKQPVLAGVGRKTDARQAAVGFSTIFASMLAKEMRNAMVGQDGGTTAMGGGAGGDMFSALFDEAMGKTLARSPAMKPLNTLMLRELGITHNAAPAASDAKQAAAGKLVKTSANVSGSRETGSGGSGAPATPQMNDFGILNFLPSDNRGPVLLPPPPSVAPILPAPSPLES